jgi:hypothetical protein
MNAIRLTNGVIENAIEFIDDVQTEDDNLTVERCYLRRSGLSVAERLSEYTEWRRGLRHRTLKLGPIPSPDDLQPLLTASKSEIAAVTHAKYAGQADRVVSIVEAIVEAVEESPDCFWNPFAVLGVCEELTESVFGERLPFVATLTPEACRFLIEHWKKGTSFAELCNALETAEGNVETALQLLID